MKCSLTLAIFFSVLLIPANALVLAARATPKTLDGITTVDAVTIKAWIDSRRWMVILDPRREDDYMNKGHLPTSVSCPVGEERDLKESSIARTVKYLEECHYLTELSKRVRVVVYCNSTT